MFSSELFDQADVLIKILKKQGIRIVTAESCTGGLLASLFTEIPGASEIFERGFITYSNDAKIENLGVPQKMIHSYGAVSSEVASAMAQGAIDNSHANLSIAITGIAGPDGGNADKPIGLVYIAISYNGNTSALKNIFKGTRSMIRLQTLEKSLELIHTAIFK